MLQNPLFPEPDKPAPEDKPKPTRGGYLLPGNSKVIQPLSQETEPSTAAATVAANPAANLIREKLARLYKSEPAAKEEIEEVEHLHHKSPHQQFMYQLSTSGKSLAEIQTEWHNYYTSLPDDQKHQVWQEFYEANEMGHYYQPVQAAAPETAQPAAAAQAAPATAQATEAVDHQPAAGVAEAKPAAKPRRSATEIKQHIRNQVQQRAKRLPSSKYKQNFHSLLFGLATGFVVLVIVMFGFFNQVILTPFIQPGRASSAPIIIDSSSVVADATPKVIIPKINVEIPVVYNIPSSDEATIQNSLENGVIHYPGTVLPGQTGNAAYFGHSSNNIFNKGKYKFAFVLLHELQKDDVFYLTYGGKAYGYKVISRAIVEPTDVGVLGNVPGQPATATLITCDPPGTSLHRLVIVGKQISPDPAGNSEGQNTSNAQQLTGNGPSLWSRLWNDIF